MNLKKLFSGLCWKEDSIKRLDVMSNVRIVNSKIYENIFEDEYNGIFGVLTECLEFGALPTPEQFGSVMLNSIDKIYAANVTKSGGRRANARIDFNAFTESDSEKDKKEAFIYACIESYKELGRTDIQAEEFRLEFALFVEDYRVNRSEQILLEVHGILTEGRWYGDKYLRGYTDHKEYYYAEMRKLETLDLMNTASLDIESGAAGLAEYLSNKSKVQRKSVMTFGIKELDEAVGYLQTSEFVTLVGETKAGKSRLAKHLDHRALMNGEDVLIVQLEGRTDEAEAMLLTRHLKVVYKYDLDDGKIVKDDALTEEDRDMIEIARTDLFTNPKYGRLKIKSGPLFYEDLLGTLMDEYEQWRPYSVLDLDYPAMILSRDPRMSEYNILTKASKMLKAWGSSVGKYGVLMIFPWQLSSKAIEQYRIDQTLPSNASAGSGEGIKSSDLSIALMADAETRALNRAQISLIAGRRVKQFAEFECLADRGHCYFGTLVS